MIFITAAVLAVATTWVWVRAAARLGLIDAPNPLVPQHRKPTVNMGGMAFATAAYLALALHSLWPGRSTAHSDGGPIAMAVAAGIGFLILGMADDLLRLSARIKFAGQIVIAVTAVAGGLRFPFFGLPWIDGAFAVLLMVSAVNATNLTDVCDGLVAGLSLIALVMASFLSPQLAPLCIAAAGACLGFLVFNAPPARVFMGDAGSHWLGFTLIAAMLSAPPQVPPLIHAAQTALLGGVFLFEIVLLIIARAMRGIPFWHGSTDHFSLRLQAAGLSRWATLATAWTVMGVLSALAVALPSLSPGARWAAMVAVILVGVAAMVLLLATTGPDRQPQPAADEPPRLLWIHQNFVSARQAGSARAVYLVAALLEKGWAVDVVTTLSGYLDAPAGRDPTPLVKEQEGRLTIHRLRFERGARLPWLILCAKAFFYIGRFRRIDVVYASMPPLSQILVSALSALVRRAPLVLEVRDLWPFTLERVGRQRPWSPGTLAMEWIEAVAYRCARHCIATSPAFTPYLEDMGMPPGRCTVAPTGIEAAAVDPGERGRWRERHGFGDDFIVAYTGSFDESYAVGRLLRAAEMSARCERPLTWVMAGGGRSRPEVLDAARRLTNVKYLGAVGNDELRTILGAADLGVVSLADDPVLHLVIPGKLFDYCAAELPVICTIDGLPGAIVRAAGAGQVLPRPTPEQLAEAVCAMAGLEPEARRARGRGARRWMLAHMPCSRSAREIADVVDDVYRQFGRRSQMVLTIGALVGAISDVATRRARRAGARLTAADPAWCDESLSEWLKRHPTRQEETPLKIPNLLTARETSAL